MPKKQNNVHRSGTSIEVSQVGDTIVRLLGPLVFPCPYSLCESDKTISPLSLIVMVNIVLSQCPMVGLRTMRAKNGLIQLVNLFFDLQKNTPVASMTMKIS